MSIQIPLGAIVSIGKAKTLWEVSATNQNLLSLLKVDGDGYVTYSKHPDEVVLRALPCQEVTLQQLLDLKGEAKKASAALADRLRLWPTPASVAEHLARAGTAIATWEKARTLHYAGRASRNIENAVGAK